jgi:hypothetical protein
MAANPVVPLLHRLLGIALVSLAAAILVLEYLGIAPILRRDSVTPVIAYALSGAGVVLAAVALLILKPRVPDRAPGQSVEQYWTRPEIGARVLPVWLLLESAGMLPAVGYLMTGELVTAFVAGLAILVYWWHGPDVIAKA